MPKTLGIWEWGCTKRCDSETPPKPGKSALGTRLLIKISSFCIFDEGHISLRLRRGNEKRKKKPKRVGTNAKKNGGNRGHNLKPKLSSFSV